MLRQLKLKVDVLSLSATPIPRTLQMSLAGLRDISVIETPPEGRRPVRTYVGPYDEDLVRRAIEREVERGGQAFFLHNRIDSLHEVAERLRGLVPRARFAEAHGQMDEQELEATMLDFLRGGADCLVTTTIIESGLDIPSANTLIVERADQLGLSQAYQIRGRVGRSRERAFAYLLYPSPEALTEEAAARLSTLADHTELGSGFRIAMRDLDIRGAGNLLGDEQSGHVAAVGFELYCQMIDEAVAGAGGAARAGEEAPGAGPPRRPRRRLPAGLLHPLRGGEDRRPPPHRRRPRAGRAAGDPRRADRPLRPAAAGGREPARPAARPDRAGAGRRAQHRVPGRAAQRHRSRAGFRGGRRPARAAWRGRCTSGGRRTAGVSVPNEPEARLAAVLAMAEALRDAKASSDMLPAS